MYLVRHMRGTASELGLKSVWKISVFKVTPDLRGCPPVSSGKNSYARHFKGLFTWREEDPSTRKILEGGTSLRHMFSVFSLHAKCCTWP